MTICDDSFSLAIRYTLKILEQYFGDTIFNITWDDTCTNDKTYLKRLDQCLDKVGRLD